MRAPHGDKDRLEYRAMDTVFVLNTLRWYARWPIKWAIGALTLVAVCYPYPGVLARHMRHAINPNALIAPQAPVIQTLADEIRPRLTPELAPAETLDTVEGFINEKLPFDWDWNTWGVADYIPTVHEAMEMGREDCDGRAVVAASLLRNFGFDAFLASDFAHIWVVTDKGETMSPGETKAVVITEEGAEINIAGLGELPRALAFGISVFPLPRELVVLGVFWFLMLRRRGGIMCGTIALILLIGGLMLLRLGSHDAGNPERWVQIAALVNMAAGLAVLVFWAGRNARAAAGNNQPPGVNVAQSVP